MNESEQQKTTVVERDMTGMNNASIVQMRLNTEDLLVNIQILLSGEREEYIILPNGSTQLVKKQVGKPKANKEGIDGIMNFIRCIINSHVVQGSQKEETNVEYVMGIHLSLNDHIMENKNRWKIHTSDINLLVDSAMALIEPFTSRMIDNKERESYMPLRYMESNTQQNANKQGFFAR